MAHLNSDFSNEIQKYGSSDFRACYNCGNCTAICNLSQSDASFPRKLIRYASLGFKDKILNSKELWLCYACGDCSETCPRQAEPGELMAALRRYVIAQFEPTGLAGLLFKNNLFSIFFTLLLAVILGFFLLSIKPTHVVSRWIFEILPYELIHNIGLVIMLLAGISAIAGIIKMYSRLSKNIPDAEKNNKKKAGIASRSIKSAKRVISELIMLKFYQSCDIEDNSYWRSKPWIIRTWFIHWSIMWGFLGLFAATILNYIFKDPATDVWMPTRILGTATGMLLMYGTTIAVMYRIIKPTKAYTNSRLADWLLLIFLWLSGLTGFWMEFVVTLSIKNYMNHVIFIIHTIISMELIVLFTFSKFAHAMYRPLALFMHYFHNG